MISESPSDFMNLLDIFNKPGVRKIKTVGLIIDATCQYKTQNSKDYITKLKIIDEGLNQDATINSQKKYIHLFIFSKNPEKSPKIARIGDIIYLKRYDFNQYMEEVKGTPNMPANPCYYIFDGDDKQNFDVLDTNSDQESDYYPNEYLQKRIDHLRQFSIFYFKSRLITSMYWYGTSDIIMNESRKADFDMLLKIKSKVQDDSLNTKFELVDGKNQLYYISIQDRQFSINSIVKIRSVRGINDKLELQTNDYTSMLMLPHHFYDYKRFDENYFLILPPRENMEIEPAPLQPIQTAPIQPIEEVKQLPQIQPIQQPPPYVPQIQQIQQQPVVINRQQSHIQMNDDEGYDMSQKIGRSQIKRTRRTNKELKDQTPLKKLLDHQESYNQKAITDKDIQGKKFRVQCYIIDVKPDKFSDSLFYTCLKCNISYNYKNEPKVCCEQQCVIMYEIWFMAKDLSIENEQSVFEFYLYTLDKNGKDFFPEINLNEINTQFQKYNSLYNNHVKILRDQTSIDNYCELILEACCGEQMLAYRVVDSQLKNINSI